MDPALLAERLAERAVVTQVAVVAEGVASGRVVERLRVGQVEGGQLRWSTQVDEGRGRRLEADAHPALVVVMERPQVPVGAQPAVLAEPRGAPAESGDPVAFEPVGERPQLLEPERRRRPGDEVLAHRTRCYCVSKASTWSRSGARASRSASSRSSPSTSSSDARARVTSPSRMASSAR